MNKTILLLGCSLALALTASVLTEPRKFTAEDMIALWSPRLVNAVDYAATGGTAEQSPDVAATAADFQVERLAFGRA